MFRMHGWDNQMVEKCSRYAIWLTSLEYMCLGKGAFSERGMLENAVYHSDDAPSLTMYLYELFSYWLLNVCLARLEYLFETTRSCNGIPE